MPVWCVPTSLHHIKPLIPTKIPSFEGSPVISGSALTVSRMRNARRVVFAPFPPIALRGPEFFPVIYRFLRIPLFEPTVRCLGIFSVDPSAPILIWPSASVRPCTMKDSRSRSGRNFSIPSITPSFRTPIQALTITSSARLRTPPTQELSSWGCD